MVVNHGWQSESTDGLKSGWNFAFWSGYNGCSGLLVGHLTHTQLLEVVWCSAAVVVVVT